MEEVNMIIWEIKVKMMIIEVKEVKEMIRVKMKIIERSKRNNSRKEMIRMFEEE